MVRRTSTSTPASASTLLFSAATAPRDVWSEKFNIFVRRFSHTIAQTPEVAVERPANKYALKPPPDMRSQFLLEQDARNEYLALKPERKRARERADARREAEQLPVDPVAGMRLHAWVLVLEPIVREPPPPPPPAADFDPDDMYAAAAAAEEAARAAAEAAARAAEEAALEAAKPKFTATFVEVTTGRSFAPDAPGYHGLEFVWNHENYYVNLQEPIGAMAHVKFDFGDTLAWEHLLVGEPAEQQRANTDAASAVDEEDAEAGGEADVLVDKHLTMPASWVNELYVGQREFEERFPNRQKVVHYMRAVHERFAPYARRNGMTARLTTYDQLNYTQPLRRWEWYERRKDLLQVITIDFQARVLEEYFIQGRPDCLKYYKHCTLVDQPRTFEFYHVPRLDALMRLEVDQSHITQHYSTRGDRLYYREFQTKAHSVKVHGPKHLNLIIEKFRRNPDVPSDRDIAERSFDLHTNQIYVQFQYATDSITSNRRTFFKPPTPDYECEYLYSSDMTSAYKCSPTAADLSMLDQYRLLLRLIDDEKANRSAFDDVNELLKTLQQTRKREMASPRLYFNLFDQLRNNAPRQLYLAKMEAAERRADRAASSPADHLKPYLVHKHGPTHAQSLEIMGACLADMRADCVAVLNELQRRYDEHVTEAQYFKKFLQKFHDQFDDTDYERLCAEGEAIELNKRMTQQRLITARETFQTKYDALKRGVLLDLRLGFEVQFRLDELRKLAADEGDFERTVNELLYPMMAVQQEEEEERKRRGADRE